MCVCIQTHPINPSNRHGKKHHNTIKPAFIFIRHVNSQNQPTNQTNKINQKNTLTPHHHDRPAMSWSRPRSSTPCSSTSPTPSSRVKLLYICIYMCVYICKYIYMSMASSDDHPFITHAHHTKLTPNTDRCSKNDHSLNPPPHTHTPPHETRPKHRPLLLGGDRRGHQRPPGASRPPARRPARGGDGRLRAGRSLFLSSFVYCVCDKYIYMCVCGRMGVSSSIG